MELTVAVKYAQTPYHHIRVAVGMDIVSTTTEGAVMV